VFACAPSAAANPPSAAPQRVLVAPFELDGVRESDVVLVEDQVAFTLAAVPGFDVVSQAELELILDTAEQRQLLGCLEACATELADIAQTQLVVGGRVGKVADTFLITVFLADGATGKVLARASELAPSRRALRAAPQAAAATLHKEPGTAPAFILQKKMRLAMVGLDAIGIDDDVARNLGRAITVRLAQIDRVEVLSWSDVEAMMSLERTRQLLGCLDQLECISEIGGAIGADGLVAGHVGLLGDTYVIGLKLVDTVNATVLARTSESFRGDANQLIRAARFAVGTLLGVTQGGEGTLEIAANVREGSAFIGGRQRRLDDATTPLPVGKHLLRIEADDHLPWISDVYVERGVTARVDAELIGRPIAWYERWYVWLAIGAVVAGGAAAAAVALRPQDGALELTAAQPGQL